MGFDQETPIYTDFNIKNYLKIMKSAVFIILKIVNFRRASSFLQPLQSKFKDNRNLFDKEAQLSMQRKVK